jgi:hypothetical protein
MRRKRREWVWSMVAVLTLCFVSERHAEAYVDPGSASYVFQLLIGGFFAAVYLTRGYWERLKGFVRTRVFRANHVGE